MVGMTLVVQCSTPNIAGQDGVCLYVYH